MYSQSASGSHPYPLLPFYLLTIINSCWETVEDKYLVVCLNRVYEYTVGATIKQLWKNKENKTTNVYVSATVSKCFLIVVEEDIIKIYFAILHVDDMKSHSPLD